MQDIYCQELDQILSTTKEKFYDITPARKKYHHYMYLKIKDVIKESPYSTKSKYLLLTHFLEEQNFGIQPFHLDLKIATMLYS